MTETFRISNFVKHKNIIEPMRVGSSLTIRNVVKNEYEFSGYYRCYWFDLKTNQFKNGVFHQKVLHRIYYFSLEKKINKIKADLLFSEIKY